MIQEKKFNEFKSLLGQKLTILEDKPEETVDSTLKALWLKAAGISKPAEEAIKSDLPDLSNKQISDLERLIEQRLNNTPLAHLTGKQLFMGIELLSDNRALIPRKETEILGKAALEACKLIASNKENPLVLDICCGSGNLGIALALLEPKIKVYCSDLSPDAIDLANENIKFHNLSGRVNARQGSLFEPFYNNDFIGKVDLIVCNPPYISTAKVRKMNSEISNNEPTLAFDGGMLGTKVIQQLLNEATIYLRQGGHLLFEIGLQQGQFFYGLCLKHHKFKEVSTVNDSAGNIRVIYCKV